MMAKKSKRSSSMRVDVTGTRLSGWLSGWGRDNAPQQRMSRARRKREALRETRMTPWEKAVAGNLPRTPIELVNAPCYLLTYLYGWVKISMVIFRPDTHEDQQDAVYELVFAHPIYDNRGNGGEDVTAALFSPGETVYVLDVSDPMFG